MITRLKAVFILFMLLFLCCRHSAQVQNMTPDLWAEDLYYLQKKLSKQFKNPTPALQPLLFDGLQELHKRLVQLSNEQTAIELGKVLATQQDGHTELDLMQNAVGFKRLPLNFYFFGKELYIISAGPEYHGLLGKRILSIDGVAVAEVFERLLPIIPADNEMETWHMAPIYLLAPQVLYELGITTRKNTVQLQLADGSEKEILGVTIADYQGQDWKNVRALKNLEPPLYLQQQNKQYWYKFLPAEKTIYFKFNRVNKQKGEISIARFMKKMFAEIDRIRPEKLIIDMRHNNGGNYNRSKPLLKGVRKRPWLNQAGKIFILTSRRTFSAASATTLFLKRDALVTIVGEHSRSKPNGSQNSEVMVLPNSKLRISYTNRLIVHWPEKGTAKLPPLDESIPVQFKDYAQAKDPVLDWVLKQ